MSSKLKNTGLALVVTGGLAVGGYSLYNQTEEEKPVVETNITELNTLEAKTVEKKNVDAEKVEVKQDWTLHILPDTIADHQIVTKTYFTLSFSQEHKQADWVAYKLLPFPESQSVERKSAFKADPDVSGGSATLEDYKGKKLYDRGHLAPAKAMSFNALAMKESFFLSNMSPQISGFNRGIWKSLEAGIYDLSKKSDSLYVVSGPVLNDPSTFIGESKVSVPRSYYKTVVRFQNGEVTGIGFLLENKKYEKGASYRSYAISIDSLEQITGIDFYQQLNDDLEANIERNYEVSLLFPKKK